MCRQGLREEREEVRVWGGSTQCVSVCARADYGVDGVIALGTGPTSDGLLGEDPQTGPLPPVYDPVSRLLTAQRYCHLYREWELEGLLDNLGQEVEVEIVERGYDKGNWFVTARKIGAGVGPTP